MYIGLYVRYPLFLSDFDENWFLFVRVSKNPEVLKFMKVLVVGAELLHTDWQTNRREEADSRFSQFYDSAYWVSTAGILAEIPLQS